MAAVTNIVLETLAFIYDLFIKLVPMVMVTVINSYNSSKMHNLTLLRHFKWVISA